MQRRYLVALLVTLALCGVAWWSARPRAQRGRAPVPRVAVARAPGAVAPGERAAPRALADVPAAEDMALLRCSADVRGRRVVAQSAEGADPVEPDASGTFLLAPGTWRLVAETDEGTRLLGELSLGAGDVVPCDLSEPEVRGSVRTPKGLPLADVPIGGSGCPSTVSAADGSFAIAGAPAGCALQAWYRDGMLRRRSNVVLLTPWRTGDVELVLDTTPVAGLGIGIAPHPDGIRVRQVYPDTPAERAGLERGDVIVTLDGTDLGPDPDVETFIALGTGPEGSTVRIEVLRGDALRAFTLTRARIPKR